MGGRKGIAPILDVVGDLGIGINIVQSVSDVFGVSCGEIIVVADGVDEDDVAKKRLVRSEVLTLAMFAIENVDGKGDVAIEDLVDAHLLESADELIDF